MKFKRIEEGFVGPVIVPVNSGNTMFDLYANLFLLFTTLSGFGFAAWHTTGGMWRTKLAFKKFWSFLTRNKDYRIYKDIKDKYEKIMNNPDVIKLIQEFDSKKNEPDFYKYEKKFSKKLSSILHNYLSEKEYEILRQMVGIYAKSNTTEPSYQELLNLGKKLYKDGELK